MMPAAPNWRASQECLLKQICSRQGKDANRTRLGAPLLEDRGDPILCLKKRLAALCFARKNHHCTMPAKAASAKANQPKETPAGRWVGYRPEIKVLDCTIRDGGLMNNHHFDDQVVKAVYTACVEAGVDYMELGYKASRKIVVPGEYGPWKICTEEDVRRIVGDNPSSLKLSVMADAERTDYHEDILPKDQSVIDLIRIATYINQIPTALEMVKDAHDKGYETNVNLMAVSTVPEYELDEGLHLLAESEAEGIYVVDSFGTLYGEQVQYLVRKYLHYAKRAGKEVGMHAHNNLQLAFSNTVEAIIRGRTWSTPVWRAWAGAPAIARWNCSSVFSTTPNTTSCPSSAAFRTRSNRCVRA